MTNYEQAIIIPIKNKRKINKLRKKFDSNYKKYKAHLTLIYRFKKLNDKIIHKHIKQSIKKIKPFEVIFQGYSKSKKEFFLYFDPKKGKGNLMKLHKVLKTGPLKHIENPRMPRYTPHISLGFFETKKEISLAIKKLPKNLKVKEIIDLVQLITINKNRVTKKFKNFKLK